MITIWKQEFEIADDFTLKLPEKAQILKVGTQYGNPRPCIWFMVESEAPKVDTHWRIYGTGHDVYPADDEDLFYQGTFELVIEGKSFMWHLFRVIKKEVTSEDHRSIENPPSKN